MMRIPGCSKSLVNGLLRVLPDPKKGFIYWYKQAQLSGYYDPTAGVENLEGSQVLHEGIDRGLFLVIEGLDGCANRAIIKEMPLR